MPDAADVPDGRNFSLVLGGPVYQGLRRARLTDEALGLLHRRIIFFILVTWVPLLLLSAPRGDLLGPGRLPFLNDIGFHLRFLVVGPLLIAAELIVHLRLQPVIDEFHARGLVRPRDEARFDAALAEATRSRNSVFAEAVMLVIVYAVGILLTVHRYRTVGGDAWYVETGGRALTPAGAWLVFVSLPLLQFLLLRWYFRVFIWARFLWRVSRLDLELNVTHPDKSGGLGFLTDSLIAFIPLAMAHGVLFAGMMATRIFFNGAELIDFELEIVAGIVLLIGLFAGPLLVFSPMLARVKREGLREYGALGQTYVKEFRDKWLRGTRPADEALVGTGDIQSLADLGNSFATAEQMRFAPIRPAAFAMFVSSFLAPMLPLIFTVLSPQEVIDRLAGLVL